MRDPKSFSSKEELKDYLNTTEGLELTWSQKLHLWIDAKNHIYSKMQKKQKLSLFLRIKLGVKKIYNLIRYGNSYHIKVDKGLSENIMMQEGLYTSISLKEVILNDPLPKDNVPFRVYRQDLPGGLVYEVKSNQVDSNKKKEK